MPIRFLIIVLSVLATSGCGGTLDVLSESVDSLKDQVFEKDNSEPPNELIEINAEIEPEIVWTNSIGVGSNDMILKLVPVIVDEKIVVADSNGLVKAMDSISGEVLWEVELEQPISAGPGSGIGLIFLGTSDAKIIALNIEDGSEQWQQTVSSEVLSIPRAQRNVVVVRTVDGKLTGLDESNGSQLWAYERSVPPLSLRGTGTPAIDGNLIIGGYASGKLVALQLADGKVEWESTIARPEGRSELERLVDLDTDPLIIDNVIYLGSFQGGVFGVTVQDGQVIWVRDNISSFSGLSSDWRYLYLCDEASDIWALDQRNGASLWKQEELHRRSLSAPVVYKDYIIVGDFEGYLHFLSQFDGHQVARINIDGEPIISSPLVSDDTLYVYDKAGTLAAIQVE